MTVAANGASISWRQWLLSERPQSRMQARLGRAYNSWLRFSANRLAVLGLGIILALLVVAAFADLLAPYSPVIGDLREARLLPPGPEHWLGTDGQGRDILSRLIFGARPLGKDSAAAVQAVLDRHAIDVALENLPGGERRVIQMRFGLDGHPEQQVIRQARKAVDQRWCRPRGPRASRPACC